MAANHSLQWTATGKPLGSRTGQCHHPLRELSAVPALAPHLKRQTAHPAPVRAAARTGMKRRLLLLAGLLVQAPQAFAVRSGRLRELPPTMVVLHSTGGPTCDKEGKPIWVPAGELRENLQVIEAHPRLGIHFMIGRDGTVVASVPETHVAHHVFSHSERSLGIELVNDGDGRDVYPEAQISALVELLRTLVRRYAIGPSGIKRHSDLDNGRLACAPGRRRKVDPGPAFPFEEVVLRTFGPR